MTEEPKRDRAAGWAEYYKTTLGREPRPLFIKGMAAIEAAGVAPGEAVEIGFGDGTETLALLGMGWQVLAIDPTPDAAVTLRAHASDADAARLEILSVPAEGIELPPFDLLYAGYALPFLSPGNLAAFWVEMRRRLRPGGFLVVNLFGDRDTWNGKPSMTFLGEAAVRRMVEGLDLIALDEEDQDGDSFLGRKHWHVFDVIARQPS